MHSKQKHPVPSSCKIRHLWDTLYECLMISSYRCDKAIIVGTRCFCRHPNRDSFRMITDAVGTQLNIDFHEHVINNTVIP